MEAGLWAPTSPAMGGSASCAESCPYCRATFPGISPVVCVIWHNGEIGDVTTEGDAPWRTQDGAFLLG